MSPNVDSDAIDIHHTFKMCEGCFVALHRDAGVIGRTEGEVNHLIHTGGLRPSPLSVIVSTLTGACAP